MAIYKGTAYCEVLSATGNRYFSVRWGNGDTDSSTKEDGAVWSENAGTGAVTLYFMQSTTGLTPPSAPNSVEVSLYEADSVTVLDTHTFSPGTGNHSFTLYATTDGTATGTPVIGDYRLYIRAIRTDIGTYDVNSDTQNTSGIIRINPTSMALAAWHTGVADPASWGDSIKLNIDLSHGFALSRPHRHFTMEARNSDTAAVYVTDTTEGTDPQNGEVVVTDIFPAGEVPVDIDALIIAMPSAIAPTSEPDATWIIVPSTTTGYVDEKRARAVARMPVNAAVTVDHHLQINDNVIAVAKDTLTKSRLVSQLGFVGFRLLNARSEGLNGLTATETLNDLNNLVAPAVNRSVTTATVNGEVGWSPTLAAWDSSLPGGTWVHDVAITTATADTAEIGEAENYSLLSINPNLQIVVAGGHPAAVNQTEHWNPGDDLLVGLAIYDATDQQLQAADATPAPTAVIGRFNTSLGQAQYLASDYTWAALTATATAYRWPLSQSAGDPNVWLTQLPGSVTTTFSHASLFFIGTAYVQGTPYSGSSELPAPGLANKHSGYQIDPIAFALHGVVGNR